MSSATPPSRKEKGKTNSSSKKKKEYIQQYLEIPREVKLALSTFEIPEALSQYTRLQPLGRATDSVAYEYGVMIMNPLKTKYWICKASAECRKRTETIDLNKTGSATGILRATSTSSIARHLADEHNITGVKSSIEMDRKTQFTNEAQQIVESDLYKRNISRCGDLLTTKLILNHSLPYRFVHYQEYRMFNTIMTKDGALKAKPVVCLLFSYP